MRGAAATLKPLDKGLALPAVRNARLPRAQAHAARYGVRFVDEPPRLILYFHRVFALRVK